MSAPSGGEGRLRAAAVALLYAAGVAHWLWFFTLQGPPKTAEDWPKEYRYYTVLKQAVTEGAVPYYLSRAIHTRKFLSLPEALASPQLVLLRFLEPGTFIVVNTLLLYSAGFVGLLLLARRYRLGSLPFAMLWLLTMFNGHVSAHLAAGHSMWAGCFLLPFFVLVVRQIVEGAPGARPAERLGLILFLVLLQGAFHAFVWCLLFLALLAAFQRRHALTLGAGIAWACVLGLFRLAPAAFLLPRRDQEFVTGFPDVAELFAALALLRNPGHPHVNGLGWWEYDSYLSGIGLLWLIGGFAYLRRRADAPPGGRALEVPLLAFATLSLGSFYGWLVPLVPPLGVERVSARFLLLPLLFLFVEAAIGMQRALDGGGRLVVRAAGVSAALGLAACLLAHSFVWRPAAFAHNVRERTPDLAIAIVPVESVTPPLQDERYRAAVNGAALVSLAALVALAWRLARAPRLTPGAPGA